MNKKIDKATKKAINTVTKKYVNKENVYGVPSVFLALGAVGMAADFLTTGGAITMASLTANITAPAMAGTGGLFLFRARTCKRENTAGQTIVCNEVIDTSLYKIQKKLSESFNAASKVLASSQEKENFLALATLSRQEVQTLAPTFKIISGGTNGFGTEKFELIVEAHDNKAGGKTLVTLDQAVAEVQGRALPRRNDAGGFRL